MGLDQVYVGLTAVVLIGLVTSQVLRKSFDPFAPIWIFLVAFAQVYVVQAISYRDWAVSARGLDLVTQANGRALWALVWFLAVYYCGVPRRIAARLPRAPAHWSASTIVMITPWMIIWGLICSGITIHDREVSAEENLIRQFPLVMQVAAVLLIVTGRQPDRPRPFLTAAGLSVALAYCLIWMLNGKRSHSVIAVLTSLSAYYLPRWRRPSLLSLSVIAVLCALVVSLALGWRGTTRYPNTLSGFAQYVTEFDPSAILVNLNVKERNEVDPEFAEQSSKETEEYGGFLLMMDTVPAKSAHDFGKSYLRIVTTYIPRVIWKTKPIYGREEWVNAWIAGSEFPRDETFTGPAIGILGATQLNGGSIATLIVLAVVALLLRTSYDYYRYHAATPWAQAWWSLTFFNAWLMPLNDDPFVFFYYLYGHTTLAPLLALAFWMRVTTPGRPVVGQTMSPAVSPT